MPCARRHVPLLMALSLVLSACLPPGDDSATGEPPLALDLNDVSILLPPPTAPADPVLAITDIAFDGQAVWPESVFQQFLAIANGDAGAVAGGDVANNAKGSRLDVGAFADQAVWHVASIRIDPGAPGVSPDIAAAFGQTPQIRLVLQPVTEGVVVHDVAAHVIYSYPSGIEPILGCPLPRFIPDRERFSAIVDGVVALKSKLAFGEIGDEAIDTGGLLGIHPAADPATTGMATRAAFRDELKRFLGAHLDPSKLRAMAVMGLPGGGAPEPWIFLAMAPDPASGAFVPLPSPALAQDQPRFAQMLDARPSASSNPSVSPRAKANNLSPITCQFERPVDPDEPEAPKPPSDTRGLSTDELFPDGDPERMREIVAVIADPARSHFFNTDCVSCHTETRREMDILGSDDIDAPIDPGVLPTELWNVRNFGWFPSFLDDGVFATATRRTATESQEVVEAINADLEAR